MKRLSVIIPTKNRPGFLLESLGSILESSDKDDIEIIIVDDGSNSQMAHKNMEVCRNLNDGVKYLLIEGGGPASARNMGIGIAGAPLLLFAGDDVIFPKKTITEHLYFHEKTHKDRNCSMAGEIKWDNSLSGKEILRFLDRENLQFVKNDIEGDITETDFNLFYSSNLSLKKDFIVKQNLYFDESFPYAAWEDIELGYRCQKAGMKIFFNAKAPAFHFHEQNVANISERMEKNGMSLRIFLEKWPELADNFGYRFVNGDFKRNRNIVKLVVRNKFIVSLVEKRFFNKSGNEEVAGLSAFFLKNMFFYYFHRGFKKGISKQVEY